MSKHTRLQLGFTRELLAVKSCTPDEIHTRRVFYERQKREQKAHTRKMQRTGHWPTK